MDAMGVDQTLLYPTWFAEGFFLVGDPDVAYALARAYNDWVIDFCKAAPHRLYAAAILPLQNMDFALDELQRVARIPSTIPITTRYGPNSSGLGLQRQCMQRRGSGTRNGPRTGRSSRKSRIVSLSPLSRAAVADHSLAAAAARASQ